MILGCVFVPAMVECDMPPSASCDQTFFQLLFYVTYQTSLKAAKGLHAKRCKHV